MFRKEIHLPWQQRAGRGTSDAGEGWSIVDVNVVGQELNASLPSARTSRVSKSIALKETQQSQVWGSPTRTGKASRRLELCLLQLEWLQVLLPESPLRPLLYIPLPVSLRLVIICLFVSVRSAGTKKSSRSYIDRSVGHITSLHEVGRLEVARRPYWMHCRSLF